MERSALDVDTVWTVGGGFALDHAVLPVVAVFILFMCSGSLRSVSMTTLVLVRHAKSDWGSPTLDDHDRPVLLLRNEWALQWVREDWPGLTFLEYAPKD